LLFAVEVETRTVHNRQRSQLQISAEYTGHCNSR
jgi:hypothetical protein